MKKILFCFILVFIFNACEKVAITDRNQLHLFSDKRMFNLGVESYNEYMASATRSTDRVNTAKIETIGRRIADAVEAYLRENGHSSDLKYFEWEFSLVRDNTVNAFCLPGGKVVFLDGILNLTQNDNGIAVVMGHEIAHAVAKHSNERMSQQLMIQFGTAAAGIALGGFSTEVQQVWGTVIGLGTQVGIMLPYSRKHEYEADELGLIFMAMAGYDPQEAVDFWQRMADMSGGGSTLEFLSTHPSDEHRIAKIKEELPKALEYYNPQQ